MRVIPSSKEGHTSTEFLMFGVCVPNSSQQLCLLWLALSPWHPAITASVSGVWSLPLSFYLIQERKNLTSPVSNRDFYETELGNSNMDFRWSKAHPDNNKNSYIHFHTLRFLSLKLFRLICNPACRVGTDTSRSTECCIMHQLQSLIKYYRRTVQENQGQT